MNGGEGTALDPQRQLRTQLASQDVAANIPMTLGKQQTIDDFQDVIEVDELPPQQNNNDDDEFYSIRMKESRQFSRTSTLKKHPSKPPIVSQEASLKQPHPKWDPPSNHDIELPKAPPVQAYSPSPTPQNQMDDDDEAVFYSQQEFKDDQQQGFFSVLWTGIKQKLGYVQTEIQNEFAYLDRKVKDALKNQRERLNHWVRIKVEEIIIGLLTQLRPQIQDTIKDPYMIQCVKDFVDDAVDEVWPSVEDEVLYKLRLKIDQPYDISNVNIRPQVRCCLQLPWLWLKAWYLYTVEPFDKSFWQQVRTCSWWIFLIARLIPFYGLQSYFYFVIFVMIDKNDEFQLVQFILNFKRMQFFSIGGFGSLFGYFVFYSCSTASEESDPEYYRSCRQQGPALFLQVWTDILGFLIQLGLIWFTFMMLPCSQPKGKLKFRYAMQPEAAKYNDRCLCFDFNVDRGGRLKGFIIWDGFSFLVCLFVFLYLAYGGGEKQSWQIRSTMYFVKTLYGILSFPFIVFVIPYMTFLFTRARPTGYDVYGNCVPKVKDLKKYHKDRKKKCATMKEEDTVNMYDEIYVNYHDEMSRHQKNSLAKQNFFGDLLAFEDEPET